ncbi:hypothetical protein CLOM_g16931 [Closterium sp. NIES-68]|nr:hypothetical protein CLOM_g16931 [Closterium sp. NIES-68]GJP65335.1 hypothetical protein CLOP_g22233 [Closterium sp. NIES-67]
MIEGLTAEQTRTLTLINVVASAFSFLGSGFIVLCYLGFKDLRKFSFKLIFYLSLSDMLCSLFNLLGNPGEGPLCYMQGYATQFFWVASFLWTTTIAYTLHRTVVRHKADVEGLGPYFHVYVWGTAALMTLIPSVGSDYGPAGAWCWVQNETVTGKVLRFLTFYVPLWSAILFNGVIYFQVIRMLSNATRMAANMADRQKQMQGPASSKVSSAMNRWGYYPLILIASWTCGTINKIHNLLEPHRPLFILYCLHIGTAALMGLFNSIAYGFNSAVRRTLREKLMQNWPERLRMWGPASPTFLRLESDSAEESELACLGGTDTENETEPETEPS